MTDPSTDAPVEAPVEEMVEAPVEPKPTFTIAVDDLPPPGEAITVTPAQPPIMPGQPMPPSDVPPGNFAGGVLPEAAPVEPVISAATLAEQEAGRAAVERARAAVEASRARAEESNARRMRENGPADEGDLAYTAPKE